MQYNGQRKNNKKRQKKWSTKHYSENKKLSKPNLIIHRDYRKWSGYISSACPTSDTHHAFILKIYLATMPAYDVIKGKSLKWNSNEAFIIGTLLHYWPAASDWHITLHNIISTTPWQGRESSWLFVGRRVGRYQRGNQNEYAVSTMTQRKSTDGQTTIYKTFI